MEGSRSLRRVANNLRDGLMLKNFVIGTSERLLQGRERKRLKVGRTGGRERDLGVEGVVVTKRRMRSGVPDLQLEFLAEAQVAFLLL